MLQSWAQRLCRPTRDLHAIVRDGQLVARGRSLWLDAQHSYVSLVYVTEAWRGQGLGRALIAHLLADDIARRVRWSVLIASRMGERLYAEQGYHALGAILIFEPNEGGVAEAEGGDG